MSTTPYLTNCYIPTISKEKEEKESTTKTQLSESEFLSLHHPNRYPINDTTKPQNKRSTKELRCISIDRNILSKSNGSSIIEIGNTKVICNVNGPRSSSSSFTKKQNEFQSDGTLNCEVRYAPYFTDDSNTSNKEIELSERVRDVIIRSIPLHKLSKSVIDVYIMIISSDGDSSVFNACVSSASIALSDAGIELCDLISSCSVAVVQYSKGSYMYLLDPTNQEEKDSTIVTLAMLCNWKEVVFLDQSGGAQQLPSIVSLKAMELCRDGCMVMGKFMRQCLLKHKN